MAPIAAGRLIDGQRRERGSLRAQHPRAEPDAANKREFAQSVKLRPLEAAFRTDEKRQRPNPKPRHGIADRLAPPALLTDNQPPLPAPRRADSAQPLLRS